jgi:hypothetical protein
LGFWHTGYLDQLGLGPPGVHFDTVAPAPEPLAPEFLCARCGEAFDTFLELETHTFGGHPEPRPILYYRGRECGTTTVNIVSLTTPDDWSILQVEQAWLNNQQVEPNRVCDMLARESHRVVDLRLAAGQITATFRLGFQVPDPSDLDGVDHCLSTLANGQQLDWRSIDHFVGQCQQFRTAQAYYDAFAQYFYGVLARERSPDSGLPSSAYRGKYEYAASQLTQYDRVVARTVSSIIAFHFNQFTQASAGGGGSPRLLQAADRILNCLAGKKPSKKVKSESQGFDPLFTDAETERVLRWVCIPFDVSAGEDVTAMESYLVGCESYDRVKLQVIAAVYHEEAGEWDRARRHVDDLLHNDLTAEWATTMRNRH